MTGHSAEQPSGAQPDPLDPGLGVTGEDDTTGEADTAAAEAETQPVDVDTEPATTGDDDYVEPPD